MKLAKLICSALLLVTFFTFSQCKKKDVPQLPPETETGAMTFGCKVNGEIFVPQDGNGRSGFKVEYVNLGTEPGGGWYLNIAAFDRKSISRPLVSVTTDSLLISEGSTYNFKNAKGNAKAFYVTSGNVFSKLDNDTGQLKIIKFDQLSRIISGTFLFTGTDENGGKVNVTEGRFDVRY
jgi:hypothetical protein